MFRKKKSRQDVCGYLLGERLGAGATGEVWQGIGPGGTRVALKFVRCEHDGACREFLCIHRAKHIRHANLLPALAVYLLDRHRQPLPESQFAVDLRSGSEATPEMLRNLCRGRAPAELLIVTPLAEKTLEHRFNECVESGLPGIPGEELVEYLSDAARALDYLNDCRIDFGDGPVGIQHGDVKPANILLMGTSAVVADFGISRSLRSQVVTAGLGTPAFVAPEVILEQPPHPHTDQYSLALTWYTLRTGRLAVNGDSKYSAMISHVQGCLNLDGISEPEQEILRKATSLNPDERYETCRHFVAALRGTLNRTIRLTLPVDAAESRPRTPRCPGEGATPVQVPESHTSQKDNQPEDSRHSPSAARTPHGTMRPDGLAARRSTSSRHVSTGPIASGETKRHAAAREPAASGHAPRTSAARPSGIVGRRCVNEPSLAGLFHQSCTRLKVAVRSPWTSLGAVAILLIMIVTVHGGNSSAGATAGTAVADLAASGNSVAVPPGDSAVTGQPVPVATATQLPPAEDSEGRLTPTSDTSRPETEAPRETHRPDGPQVDPERCPSPVKSCVVIIRRSPANHGCGSHVTAGSIRWNGSRSGTRFANRGPLPTRQTESMAYSRHTRSLGSDCAGPGAR